MDFSTRNQTPAATPSAHTASPATTSSSNSKRGKPDQNKWRRIVSVVLGGALLILIVALIASISFSSNHSESSYVDSSKLQAVFLNTGQVYFGNIKKLNNQYLVLTNIYYLQTSNNGAGASSSANTNVSLVKLGCELHEPYDQMVINRDQVTFWENLQDNGQVAKAVATFEKQNPNGQKCADQSSSSSPTSNSVQRATTNSSSPSTPTAPTSTTPSTTPSTRP